MSELKDLIAKLKLEKENGTAEYKAETSGNHAENANMPTHGRNLAGTSGFGGLFRHARTGPTFC